MIHRRQLQLAAVSWAVAAWTSGLCAGCDPGRIAQGEGKPGLRIVSTSPSMTELVFALGRGDALVGRSAYCDHPPEAKRVEVIGGFADPSVERIVALAPTLVCGERGPAGPELVAALERAGLKTFFPPLDRVKDIASATIELGRQIDAEAQAQQVAAEIDVKLAEIAQRVRDRARPKVVMLFDWRPLIVAGSASFPSEMVSLAGGTNAVDDTLKYPTLGPEGLLSLDPDWLIDGSGEAYENEAPMVLARSIPGLDALRAVQGGHLHRLTGSEALRPGPRIAQGVQQIARLLHPTAFEG